MNLTSLALHLGTSRCVGCSVRAGILCGSCLETVGPAIGVQRPLRNIDRVVAAWDYSGAARSLVLALKARGKRDAAVAIADAIVDRVHVTGLDVDGLAWIPGRARDRRGRGFDHAELIARNLARRLGLPALPILRRAVMTADQTALGATARRANVSGAFFATGVPPRVAVVDDLVTTGATLSEAGRALRAGGAVYVDGLVGCVVA